MDLVAEHAGPGTNPGGRSLSVDRLETALASAEGKGSAVVDIHARRALRVAIDSSDGTLPSVEQNLQRWYDSAMDRVSGRYRRGTQGLLFLLGLAVAVGLNINTITIADYLARKDAAREAIVARVRQGLTSEQLLAAIDRDRQPSTPTTTAPVNPTLGAARAPDSVTIGLLAGLDLPIGWGGDVPRLGNGRSQHGAWHDYAVHVFGLLLTALAVMIGAPFWFDVLNKFMVIRSTVKPHEKSPEEGSEDRQQSAPVTISMRSPQGVPPGGAEPNEPQRPVPIHEVDDPGVALNAALAQHRAGLWRSGVKSIGGGIKFINGRATPCILVKVEEKMTSPAGIQGLTAIGALLPKSVATLTASGETVHVPIDVIADGTPKANSCSVGTGLCNQRDPENAGTIGPVVKRSGDPADYVVTCYHVVRFNQSWEKFVPSEDDRVHFVEDNGVTQPVGSIAAGFRSTNGDFALVRIDASARVERQIRGSGRTASGFRRPTWRDVFDRTAVFVAGKNQPSPRPASVVGLQESALLAYSDGSTQRLDGLMTIASLVGGAFSPASQPGDSGALVFDTAGVAIGIVVGAGNSVTYVMLIAGLFSTLGLSM
jgi:hypothetical protein